VTGLVSLETSFLIDLLRKDPAAVARAQILEASGEPRCVTAPAAAEILIGATLRGGRALERARELLASLVLLPFDFEACEEAGRLGAQLISHGEELASSDLFIAAITKRNGQRLLTRDRAFARIRGLTVETY
jgi:predicted nucleic acid-binding protein